MTEEKQRISPFTETIYCQVKAVRESAEGYVTYVFRNLMDGTYRMVTKLPNWSIPHLAVGDKGYMKYVEALAGQDTWYDRDSEKYVTYRYDGQYLVDWIFSAYEKDEKGNILPSERKRER